MRYIYFVIIILMSNCTTSPSIETSEEVNLCHIPKLNKSKDLLNLGDEKESEITSRKINGIKYTSKTFSSEEQNIEFTINYHDGDVLYEIDNRVFGFKKGTYFRLEDRDLSDGLGWMFFDNHIINVGGVKYLISRTYPNFNESVAFNNIYFIINLSEKDKEIAYSLGSFGYCNNTIGDYNNDGKLDMILIDLLKTSGEKMDRQDPKGIFEAHTFTLSEGNILPLENRKGHMKCKYSYEGESTKLIEGNWF